MKLVYEQLFLSNSEERDDARSKLWYWQDILLERPPVEVQFDMEINLCIHVMPDHALVLHNITPGDAGFYYCLKYSFLLDGKPNFSQTFLYFLIWHGSWAIFQNQSNIRVIIDTQWYIFQE